VKVAQEHGLETDSFTIQDAVALLGKQAYEQRATHKRIKNGLSALASLSESSKTASTQAALMPGHLFQKVARAYKLEKLAELADSETRSALLDERRAVVDATYSQLYKEAGVLDAAKSSRAAEGLSEFLKSDAGSAGVKGLAAGAGLAVPGIAAGSYLSDKATSDARDKALQAAAGTAALGLTAYGIGRGVDHFTERNASGSSCLEDLETTFYVDALLAQEPPSEKIAALRQVNRDYGMTLLYKAIL